MSEDWYPWYPALFAADTMHLSAAQDGIYRRLIDWYMTQRRPLPADDEALAGIARVTLEEWKLHSAVVRKFFRRNKKRLTHKRCDSELEKQDLRGRKRGEVARKGAAERWRGHKNLDAASMQEASSKHAEGMLEGCLGDAEPMLSDATGHDRTRHSKKEQPSSSVAPAIAANGVAPGPDLTAPPERENGGDGFSHEDFDRLVVKTGSPRALGNPRAQTPRETS